MVNRYKKPIRVLFIEYVSNHFLFDLETMAGFVYAPPVQVQEAA